MAAGEDGGVRKLVSIIIPVHNAASTLPDTITSILSQDYQPLELSVFDDGSTDGSWEVLCGFEEKIRAGSYEGVSMVLSRGGGRVLVGDGDGSVGGSPGYSRNRAVAQSHGSVLVLQDADDCMLPGRISTQVDALLSHPFALIGATFSRDPPDATPRYAKWANSLSTAADFALHEFREVPLVQPTWCMHRHLWDAVGGYVEEVHGLRALGRMKGVEIVEDGEESAVGKKRKRRWEKKKAKEMQMMEEGGKLWPERATGYEVYAVLPETMKGKEEREGGGLRKEAVEVIEAMVSAFNNAVRNLYISSATQLIAKERKKEKTREEEGDGGGGGEGGGGGGGGKRVGITSGEVDPSKLRLAGFPEDLAFFHAARRIGAELHRAGDAPLVLYRFSPTSFSWRVPRQLLAAVRVAAFEHRILQGRWKGREFSIWGAGRDGQTFFRFLSPQAKLLVKAFADIDPKKIGTKARGGEGPDIIHFSELQPPVVTCVALDRTDGVFEGNLASLHLPHSDVIHFA